MTLIHADGSRTEAILLARTGDKIRVAVPGGDDPLEFTDVHGTWVSEDCEPVHVEFAWQRKSKEQVMTEADCVCSHDLAARLIHLLWNGAEETKARTEAPLSSDMMMALRAAGRHGIGN